MNLMFSHWKYGSRSALTRSLFLLLAFCLEVPWATLAKTQAASIALTYDVNGNQTSQQLATAGPPVVHGSTPSQVVSPGGISGFSINVATTLAVTYQWYFNGVAIAGATGDSLLLTNISLANEGNYTVVATNSSGSVTSGTFRLGIDFSGNGLPDTWEMTYFGNLNQTADEDYDGDGISNLDEFINGTDPTVREIYYWNVASGDFNRPTNWIRHDTPGVPPQVPGAGDTAIIDTGTFTLPADTTITVSQVTVNAPFTAPADTNFTLNITGHWTFNGPFSLANGRQFAVSGNGGSVNVTGTTNLNGGNLWTSGGAKLTFANLGNYTLPPESSASWTSEGTGSELTFPNLVSINGSAAPGRYLDLSAQYGGKVSLPALTTITKADDGDAYPNSGVRFYAYGGSLLSAPQLSTFQDNDSIPNSSLYAEGGTGVIEMPLLLAPVGVQINLNAASHPEQFTSLVGTRSFEINNGTINITNLDSLAGFSFLKVSGGAKVTFSNVSSHTLPPDLGATWIGEGSGSELILLNLTSITGSATPGRYLDLSAQYGGKVSLPALTTITKPDDGDAYPNSGVRLYAYSGSLLSAPQLSTFQDNDSIPNSSLYAEGGTGVIEMPLLLAPVGVQINLNAASHPEQFTSLVGTRSLEFSNGTINITNLTSLAGFTFLKASGGAKVTFSSVSSYTLPPDLSTAWIGEGSGSELILLNLVSITGSATPGHYLDISAQYGGKVSLPALTTITKPDDGDAYANSGVRLYAYNGSILSAPYLSAFYDDDSHPNSSLNAEAGGNMLLYSLALSGIRGVTLNGVTLPPTAPPPKAINLSTRMLVQTGDNVGIGGFIITGSTTKRVIIRAIGPSLAGFGVPNALADPVLELHGPSAFVTITNNNWRDTQEVEIQATGIPPANDLESAIVATLVPGPYTAVVSGNGGTSGVGLIEVYDLNQVVDSKLANLSTRAAVSTGDNIVIAGFVLSIGNGNDRIVVRGLGPSLAAFGVPNALANPTLELRDTNGALLAANNDWHDDPAQAAEFSAAGLAPTNNLESALVAMLPTGLYTALLSGTNGSTGIGVVEVYDLGGTP